MRVYLFIILIFFAATACNVTKRLPEGEKLYTGATVKIEGDDFAKTSKKEIRDDLKSFIRPEPNTSILGIRYKLWVYQVVGETKKDKGIKHWLRTKVGEPPVLASTVDLSRNVQIITNRLENKGFFKAQASGDTIVHNKKVEAEYIAKPNVRYTIREVILPDDTTSLLERTMVQTSTKSLLKENDAYDLDVITTERERVDAFLKRHGFYFFSPDYLLMRVDSTVGKDQVDIFVTIKPETPRKAKWKYYINDIFIYPNYDLQHDTSEVNAAAIKFKDFYVIDPERKFKPQVFDRTMLFHKGEVYNVMDHNLTLNRLVNMGTFKFVKNRFEEAPYVDTPKLDAYYYLTPQKAKSIRTELNARTNTAGFAGTGLELSWRNRNTFRGAELLSIEANSGFDFQIAGANKGYNIFTIGGKMNLVWPRIVPVNFKSASAFVPRTHLTIGYDWQKRQRLYTLNTFHGSFGYIWKESVTKEHEVNPINVTFVKSSDVTKEYLDKIQQDSTLARVIEKQLIVGPTYSFTYTNTTTPTRRNEFFYNGKLDLSSNLIGIIQGADAKANDYKEILGVRYSQYAKTEQDFRYYLKIGNSQVNMWANRIYAGLGIPYGNSLQLPFIKQFYVGGTNSLRGFRARTLGPGSYRPNVGPDEFLPDQTGDIKLELNSELRFKLFSIVQGALFTDIGNIWLKNESPLKEGAKFTKNFMDDLAADVGIGFRFDLSILVLRTDFAIPVRKPWLDDKKWVFDEIAFGRKSWRRENLVFNLAIGMPF